MPTCIIDGKQAEFSPGENLIEVAKRVGIEIPYFCYHPALTVVAQCRMCAVEIEKMPKIQTACSTEAREGMVVHTQSPKVKEARQSVMEFLLINHPLDCPICDKSGECDLQDFSYGYGSAYTRYTEERRTYLDLDMGPVIKKSMNRCIHCTRCIRFGDEVAKIREMVALQRGNSTEISTIDGKPLETDYAGNYADICPTGSLTLRDFRFNKRVWMLKKTPTVCEGCSRGCNIELHWDQRTVYRTLPRENKEINGHWICDDGRFNFHYVHDEARVREPRVKGSVTAWSRAVDDARRALAAANNPLFLLGSDLTLEEVGAIREFQKERAPKAKVLQFGTPGVLKAEDDADADALLKRKSKTSNFHGLLKLGIEAVDRVEAASYDFILVFRGGRAQLPDLGAIPNVLIGVYRADELTTQSVVLPGTSFPEKSGTIVNFNGVACSKASAAMPAPSLPTPASLNTTSASGRASA